MRRSDRNSGQEILSKRRSKIPSRRESCQISKSSGNGERPSSNEIEVEKLSHLRKEVKVELFTLESQTVD